MQKVTSSFSETSDRRKEQDKLLLLSVKKMYPSLETGKLCALSFPQNLLVEQTPSVLLSSLKAVSVLGQLVLADIALWRSMIGAGMRVG